MLIFGSVKRIRYDIVETQVLVFLLPVLQLSPAAANGNGTLLLFAINGVRVWSKGANWVPPDMFLARAERYVLKIH
jgi:hypothetical protein